MKLNEIFKPDLRGGMFMKDAIEMVHEHAPKNFAKMFNEGCYLYRGFQGLPDTVSLIDSTNMSGRVSRNAEHNYYTLLMDNLPEWDGYPKRSKSYVGSTDYLKASKYGNGVYAVIPFDNVEVGFCSSRDLWASFPMLKTTFGYDWIIHFNEALDEIAEVVLHTHTTPALPDQSWRLFEEKIQEISRAIKKDPNIGVNERPASGR